MSFAVRVESGGSQGYEVETGLGVGRVLLTQATLSCYAGRGRMAVPLLRSFGETHITYDRQVSWRFSISLEGQPAEKWDPLPKSPQFRGDPRV